MIDYAIQRTNMVDSQVRPADITDRRIIRAMQSVPREAFAPASTKAISYMDDHLRVSDGGGAARYVLAARTFAKLVQLLELDAENVVLDVGCATGYSTAVLAQLVARVIGLEQDAALAERARKTLTGLGIANVEVRTGSLAGGAADAGPFDAILLNGSIAAAPDALLEQLKDRGRMAAIRTDQGLSRAMLWRRNSGVFDSRPVFDAAAPTLPGFETRPGFVF